MNEGTMRQRPRAYLLLEAAMGGAMVAVIVGSILTSLSQARTMSIITNRDQIANQLVVEKLEEQRALGFTGTAAGVTTEAVVAGVTGKYARETTIADCTETIPAPVGNQACRDITVKVTYLTSNQAKLGTSTTRSSQAVARVY
jgi:hypothetical protein